MRLRGPYNLYGSTETSIFAVPVAKTKGIYLWTIPFRRKYLAYYVGETGRSFSDRIMEHTRDYLSGLYRVYDPKQFMRGKKTLIWGGMWKPDRKSPDRMLEFLNRRSELSPAIHELLGNFRLFLAPTNVQKRMRERIEAAIASKLSEQSGLIGSFQDNDIRYLPRQTDEVPIKVKIESSELILGLSNELVV